VKTTNQKEKSLIDGSSSYPQGTDMFKSYDERLEGKITKLLKLSQPLKTGQARTFFDVYSDINAVTVVGIGSDDGGVDNLECLDEKKENIRVGIAGTFS